MRTKTRCAEAFREGGAWFGGFVKPDDARYRIIRELSKTAKRLTAAE